MTRLIAATLWTALALAAAAGAGAADTAAAERPARVTLSGELTRLDLVRSAIAIKTEGREPREGEAALTADTRIVSRGRVLRPEDLRPGDKVAVVAVEEDGARQSRLVKVMGRAAIALPASGTHS